MKKRILSIALCATMIMTVLTGCNNTKVMPDEPTDHPLTKDTIVADVTDDNPTKIDSTENDTKISKHDDSDQRFRLIEDSDDFIVNTEYNFDSDYSLNNITTVLDYVERESDNVNENTILSETSLNMALSLLLEGAGDNTESYNALINYLSGCNYPNDFLRIRSRNNALISRYMFAELNSRMSIANSAWFNTGVTPAPAYVDVLSAYYNGRTQSLDFSDATSAEIINSWCDGATDGCIPSIITPETLRMNDGLLINALYFSGTWAAPFDEHNCRDAVFTNADGSTSTVTMMYDYGYTTYYESNWCEGFMKPYEDSNLVFIGILPKENVDFAVNDLDIDDMLSNPVRGYEVNIGIPQFKISDENHLFNALYNNGLAPAFRSGNTDYLEYLSDTPLSVSDVIQMTYVDVNPEGTEAAAVTAITLEKSAAPVRDTEVHEIILDRPFVFMIYDTEAHECLFIGKINSL